jgi:hypothetical protein
MISITEQHIIQMEELGSRQKPDYLYLKTGQTGINHDYMTLNPHFSTTQMCVWTKMHHVYTFCSQHLNNGVQNKIQHKLYYVGVQAYGYFNIDKSMVDSF